MSDPSTIPSPPRRFRFGLRTLFVLMTVACMLLVIFTHSRGVWTVVGISWYVAFVWMMIRGYRILES